MEVLSFLFKLTDDMKDKINEQYIEATLSRVILGDCIIAFSESYAYITIGGSCHLLFEFLVQF